MILQFNFLIKEIWSGPDAREVGLGRARKKVWSLTGFVEVGEEVAKEGAHLRGVGCFRPIRVRQTTGLSGSWTGKILFMSLNKLGHGTMLLKMAFTSEERYSLIRFVIDLSTLANSELKKPIWEAQG